MADGPRGSRHVPIRIPDRRHARHRRRGRYERLPCREGGEPVQGDGSGEEAVIMARSVGGSSDLSHSIPPIFGDLVCSRSMYGGRPRLSLHCWVGSRIPGGKKPLQVLSSEIESDFVGYLAHAPSGRRAAPYSVNVNMSHPSDVDTLTSIGTQG